MRRWNTSEVVIMCVAVLCLVLPTLGVELAALAASPMPGRQVIEPSISPGHATSLAISSTDIAYNNAVYLPVTIAQEKYPPDNRTFELELLQLINEQREQMSLPPLRENAALTNAARRHATDIAVNNLLTHTGSDGTRPTQRMVQEGYTGIAWGEVASFAPTPQVMFNAIMRSPSHKDIVLDANANDVGLGFALRQDHHVFVINTGHSY